ncbi:MAG: glycoside hydrolase family 99-like domain-containing protein [Granulosicoccus sp.]|nr:glycoside hydrolase family 99-like domain-containing protein [Granulosicoccus sp.]
MKNRSFLAKLIAKSLRRIRGKNRQRLERHRVAALDTAAEFATVTGNVKYFSKPGPYFEEALPAADTSSTPAARVIAFYLPQFHRFEENDAWWGTGFTEWTNVVRGTPRFAGHYQPRIPRDLGFYDLTDDHTLEAQAQMARANGINAFCFYYYWFDGKRLMERPLDRFLHSDIDHSFCIMWANENWTRTWDGKESDVLVSQNYLQEHEPAFIQDTAKYMADSRYVRVQNRPLFILYRPALLPDAKNTLQRWRALWKDELGVEPWIIMVQGFGSNHPSEYGLDGAVEFPPHKVTKDVPDIDSSLHVLDPEFNGLVMDYETVVNHSLSIPTPDFPLIKTASPTWDSDARRQGRGTTLHGSTPALYRQWLSGIIDFAQTQPFHGEPLAFINAWNEWAEGAYLEPDVHNGYAYLNTTQRVVFGKSTAENNLLLVGHDAHANGAQMLLLNLARTFQDEFGMDVTVLLLSSGRLESVYKSIVNTIMLTDLVANAESTNAAIERLIAEKAVTHALCNTTVTGELIPTLKHNKVRVLSLIHEMPDYIRSQQLESAAKIIADQADNIVFPANIVRTGFNEVVGLTLQDSVFPQGLYQWFTFDAAARQRIRSELGLNNSSKLILNAGYADQRKGFDLFVQTAVQQTKRSDDLHFIWVGKIARDMRKMAERTLKKHDCFNRIHLIGFSSNMGEYYSASDCLLLTSREDPYPSVVLEAMQIGLPVIAFQGATGFDDILNIHGVLIPQADSEAMTNALDTALVKDTSTQRRARADYVEQNCKLQDYCAQLLKLLFKKPMSEPESPAQSVRKSA